MDIKGIGITIRPKARGIYTLTADFGAKQLQSTTTDSEFYDAFNGRGTLTEVEQAQTRAYEFALDLLAAWLAGNVATYNANPFNLELGALEDAMQTIIANPLEDADAEQCEKLDIDPQDAQDWDFYRAGGLYFAVLK